MALHATHNTLSDRVVALRDCTEQLLVHAGQVDSIFGRNRSARLALELGTLEASRDRSETRIKQGYIYRSLTDTSLSDGVGIHARR